MEQEYRIRELSRSVKCNNGITGVQKEEDREKGVEIFFQEAVAENFLTWARRQTSRTRRHRELPLKPTKAGQHQHIL